MDFKAVSWKANCFVQNVLSPEVYKSGKKSFKGNISRLVKAQKSGRMFGSLKSKTKNMDWNVDFVD